MKDAKIVCEDALNTTSLFQELIYILSQLGDKRKALHLHLLKIKNLRLAIHFVEKESSTDQVTLWNDLISYALKNKDLLTELLDNMGYANISPLQVISKIPTRKSITNLKQKLEDIVATMQFRESLNSQCNQLMKDDALRLLQRQNQGQRRAIKVFLSYTIVFSLAVNYLLNHQ